MPPVTDKYGHLTCATSSTYYPSTLGATQSPVIFPGINSNVENYFNASTASNTGNVKVVTDVTLPTPYLDRVPSPTTATAIPSSQLPAQGAFAQSGFDALRGAGSPINYDSSEADYGYVDPFFIKFLAQNSDYRKNYPNLAGCLPGGPSIDPGTRHANLVSTPTLSTAITNTVSTTNYQQGCFNTDSPDCATASATSPILQAVNTPPVSSSPPPSKPNGNGIGGILSLLRVIASKEASSKVLNSVTVPVPTAPSLTTPPLATSPPPTSIPPPTSTLATSSPVPPPSTTLTLATSQPSSSFFSEPSATPSIPVVSLVEPASSASEPTTSASEQETPTSILSSAPSKLPPSITASTSPPVFTGSASWTKAVPLWSVISLCALTGLFVALQ